MWDNYAGCFCAGGRFKHCEVGRAAEAGCPGSYSAQMSFSAGTGTLDDELQLLPAKWRLSTEPRQKRRLFEDGRFGVAVRAVRQTTVHVSPLCVRGPHRPPVSGLPCAVAVSRQRQLSRMAEPSADDFTLHEVLHAASRAKIMIPPVSHFLAVCLHGGVAALWPQRDPPALEHD